MITRLGGIVFSRRRSPAARLAQYSLQGPLHFFREPEVARLDSKNGVPQRCSSVVSARVLLPRSGRWTRERSRFCNEQFAVAMEM